MDDPPLDKSGMTLVRLNPLGRLTQLIVIPPQVENQTVAASSLDWAPLSLPRARFVQVAANEADVDAPG